MADCHPIAHWIFDGDLAQQKESLRGAKFSCAPSSIHKDAEEEAPDLAWVGCNPNGPQDISPGKRRIGEQDGGGTPSRSGSQGRGLLRAGNLPVILFANAASLFLFDQLRQSPCWSCRSIATGKSLQSSKSPGALVGKGRGQPIREWQPVAVAGKTWVGARAMAAMSWGDSSLVRYHRRSGVVERSPATPESGSDLSLELLAIRSLRHPHRRPSRPFIGRATTHEGGPSPGRLPEWRSWSTCRACFVVAKFRPSTRKFPLPRTNESHKDLVRPPTNLPRVRRASHCRLPGDATAGWADSIQVPGTRQK